MDALCRRYNIDITKRKKHGALLDAELLADVFLELNGGRQQGFNLKFNDISDRTNLKTTKELLYSKKLIAIKEEEKVKHEKLLKKIKNNLW